VLQWGRKIDHKPVEVYFIRNAHERTIDYST